MTNLMRKMDAMRHPLSGKEHNKDFFHFHEGAVIDWNAVFQVLTGELVGSMFRTIIPPWVCETVENNFWKSPFLRKRSDNVPAFYIGTYHYSKNLNSYFQQANEGREKLDTIFEGTQHFFNEFISGFKSYLREKNIQFRLAEHNGKLASPFRLLSWPKDAVYALKPHDDIAQCTTTIQRGFEIQNVRNFEVIAVNICLANDEHGEEGRFNCWNIQPSDKDREQLGIKETGYPYPPELLEKFDKIELPIYKGDVYLFNGKNIHGVGCIKGKSNRITLSFFMGFINNNTVVYWV